MRNIIRRLILSVVTMVPYLFLASSANAVSISFKTQLEIDALLGPHSTITFSEIVLPNLTAVGANYGGLGVTFNDYVLYGGVPPIHFPLGPNFSPPDVVNIPEIANIPGDQNWLITFNNLLDGVAFAYASGLGTTTFTALLNGTPVEAFSAVTDSGPLITNNMFGFQNILFNQVRIDLIPDDLGDYGSGIDNLQFSTVPEPSSLALLGIGLAGLAASRRFGFRCFRL